MAGTRQKHVPDENTKINLGKFRDQAFGLFRLPAGQVFGFGASIG